MLQNLISITAIDFREQDKTPINIHTNKSSDQTLSKLLEVNGISPFDALQHFEGQLSDKEDTISYLVSNCRKRNAKMYNVEVHYQTDGGKPRRRENDLCSSYK